MAIDNLFALGLTILLVMRLLPFILSWLSPPLARKLRNQMARFQALLDVGGGTLMLCLVVLLLWNRAWILALLLGAISLPAFSGLISGLRTLARTPR